MTLKKTPPWNVLVFPAASEIAIEINRALGSCKEVILYGAQQPGDSIAGFHFARLFALPPVSDPACLQQLQQLIASQKIDAIFPAHDDALAWLSAHAGQLDAAIITSSAAATQLCRSKSATYRHLEHIVPVPRLWAADQPDLAFPVFVKPDRGQGSQRARRIDTPLDLAAAVRNETDLLVMEYLPGPEYTVDCFSQSGRVLFARARERIVTRNGIATLTRSADLAFVPAWAEQIAAAIDLRGAWFFQIKQHGDGGFRLLEVAPRIAGSMALHRVMGPNFPLLSLFEAAGYPLTIDTMPAPALQMGRSLDLRFIDDRAVDAIYIDLDDTLILRGHINPRLIALIFQSHNRGIPVYLITRHQLDLAATLARYRLTGLFDGIIHITDPAIAKADHITHSHAVLIDDSFAERQDAMRRGIRSYDAAAAICLIDERA
jgi:hypothetical protein